MPNYIVQELKMCEHCCTNFIRLKTEFVNGIDTGKKYCSRCERYLLTVAMAEKIKRGRPKGATMKVHKLEVVK